MKKIQYAVTLVFVLCFLLSGCMHKQEEPPVPLGLVTHIEIVYNYRQAQLQRHYTETDKIDVILHYLHKLSPYGPATEDPEYLLGDSCKITVHLSDGSWHIYRMWGSRYLSVDFRPWQNVDKEKGSVLFHLFHHIPSDQ